MNGQGPGDNWTALFNPGETVRLRFINGGAQSTFDVRIPGLDMQVVMVDGKAVKPVDIHEFRISVAETYDVLVRPKQDKPFTIFAESLDRSGYARGTLSPVKGLEAPVPEMRPRPVRTLEDIGMGGMLPSKEMNMDMDMKDESGPRPFKPGSDINVAMHVKMPKHRYMEPGIGLGSDGWKVLTYKDLVSAEPQPYKPQVDREMTINITANMERFMFSFDGKKYSEHPGPYLFRHNERLRLWLVNHTMMDHPIHLHGMWMQIENGQPHDRIPYKHTVLVKPGEKISMLITPIEKGDWAFHCHLLYHMEAGMFQVMRVA
jgi:FtsP/CotA-like multicopper oxidase with cupredoxin domain